MAQKNWNRTPKNYDHTGLTTHHIRDVLPAVLATINDVHQQRPDLILAAWPTLIGPKLAPMTQAVSFIDGFLLVKVQNSTLHSLLNQNEKGRILSRLRQKFPNTLIKTITFKIG